MDLAYPFALALAALALPLIAFALWRRHSPYVIASSSAFDGVRPTLRVRAARFLPVLRIAALILLAVAISRPRVGHANAVIPAEGIDIALSIDISSSMGAEFGDGQSRLEAAKTVIRDFIKGRENDRIGIVVFQKDSLALAPPSLDYEALDTIVADTESGILPDGTGIGVGLATALNMLRDSTAASRIAILLTDGQHNATSISPQDAADLAAALNVRVYTIGLVEEGPEGRENVDESLLRLIADRTGAQYFAADNPEALAAVYEEIGKLETSRVGREEYQNYDELGPWFLGAAAALLAAELILGATWLRRAPA